MLDELNQLKQRIKMQIPQLTESQKNVADFIVEKPQRFALSSIRELEKELHTSKATIVRLSRALGYEGFHDLKSAFLHSIRHDLDPIHRYKAIITESKEQANYLELIADETVQNVQETLHLLARDQYNQAITLIEQADHVYTIGLGISTYLAEIAAYLLTRVGIRANAMPFGAIPFSEQMINLSKKDLVIAFSFPPYSKNTIDAARYAREKKNPVIAVTDKATNEIVQHSQITLQVPAKSSTISNSIVGALVMLYALAAQIGQDFKNKTLETIDSLDRVRKSQPKNHS